MPDGVCNRSSVAMMQANDDHTTAQPHVQLMHHKAPGFDGRERFCASRDQ